jgi:diacylglycerol kinase
MEPKKFSLSDRLKSFNYAFNGLKILIQEEHNARIHFFVAFIVIIGGFIYSISSMEWIIVIFAIGFVIAFELINTAIEQIANFISPEKHESIKRIKDIAAGAVLISVITAVLIGFIIFLPKIFS